MTSKPLISIITINLNNLEGLTKTMTSVFEQSWQGFEFLVVDGGSTDGSKEFIESHQNNLDYWVSEKDSGVYNAMNKGIKVAKGEYLLFLNSGDHFFHEDVLSENEGSVGFFDLIYFNIEVIDKTKKLISYPYPLRFGQFYYETLCHQSTLIKKQLFAKIGLYDEKLEFVSDWKFFIIAIFKYNCTYKKINNTLTTFYLDGISSDPKNYPQMAREKKEVLTTEFKAFLPEIEELFKLRTIILNLKKSRKIKLLVKLGFLNKF